MKRMYAALKAIFFFLSMLISFNLFSQEDMNESGLVPNSVNPSPDYYCTWQTQKYYTNAADPVVMRNNIIEANLFGTLPYQGWLNFYPKVRGDLFIVMDDSWDIPLKGDGSGYFGSLVLNSERFPDYAKEGVSNQEALKHLNNDVKSKGWKGLGGWVCAQEAPNFINGKTRQEYWIERAKWADYAGLAYWKVDWGKQIYDYSFRKLLTDIAHQYAPGLTVEQAQIDTVIPVSDVFRTYDVPAILSIPMTMKKLKNTLPFTPENGYKGLICAEDEVYIAAALGCTMGVMRHPMAGNLPNGKPDPSFPEIHRNIKTKIDEVTRAVRWHRIAPAFAVNAAETYIDSVKLTDSWQLQNMDEEIESWWFEPWTGFKKIGNVISESGPARISRGIPLPLVKPDENGDVPFVVAAKNPGGAVSIATSGRTRDRKYWIPYCDISINSDSATVFGIFGYYKSLTLNTTLNLINTKIKVQDLAGKVVKDITNRITKDANRIIIPGKVITEIGTGEQTPGDTSDPGLVLVIYGTNAL
ncbi:MAG TPA: hypothetical protein VIK20_07170 [Bacteroidales bacterium]